MLKMLNQDRWICVYVIGNNPKSSVDLQKFERYLFLPHFFYIIQDASEQKNIFKKNFDKAVTALTL